MKSPSIFSGGPFLKAQQEAVDFSMNLYFYNCLGESIEAHLQAQKEYDAAVLSQDEKMMAEKKGELVYYEQILLLATNMLNARHEINQ